MLELYHVLYHAACVVRAQPEAVDLLFVPDLFFFVCILAWCRVCDAHEQICYDACIGIDPTYEYFGVQFKWQCFCSKTFDPAAEVDAPAAECALPCSQNSDEDCGGANRMLTYKID